MRLKAKGRALLGFSLLVMVFFAVSCEEEVITLGEGVVGGDPFVTGRNTYDVYAANKGFSAVQTSRLPLYQLGTFADPVFGDVQARIISQVQLVNTNPTFGIWTPEQEVLEDRELPRDTLPENETIKEVFLYIPFQQAPRGSADDDNDGVINELDAEPEDAENDSDGDGVSNIDERIQGTDPLNPDTDGDGIGDLDDDDFTINNFPRRVDLDSIYGNRDIEANLRIERSTYFLRDLDPNDNFESEQSYFSNLDLSGFVEGPPIFDGPITISDEQIVFYPEDDPDTPDEDESQFIDPQLTLEPGIRVQLNSDFFQENILDKEGSSELLSQSNFKDFWRGLQFTLTSAEPLMVLLDMSDAIITVTYEFDRNNNNGTTDDFTDDFVEQLERTFNIRLLTGVGNNVSGNAVNTFTRAMPSQEVLDGLQDNGEGASRLYVKGSTGNYAEFKLFGEEGSDQAVIDAIRQNNWIINEARLRIPVDKQALADAGINLVPPRLYLYNTRTQRPLYNTFSDFSISDTPLGLFLNFDGILSEEDGVEDAVYEFRITDYVNDIILRDSINDPIALVATADLASTRTSPGLDEVMTVTEDEYPVTSVITPFSTVLFGSNVGPGEEDKRVTLTLFFTEVE